MKTVRFLGMTLLMVLCAVNFTACDNDDEVTLDLNSLEGTWILVNSKGWETSSTGSGEKREWNVTFNPDNFTGGNPDDAIGGSQRVIIEKISENKYSFIYGEYTGHDWYQEPMKIAHINGQNIIFENDIYNTSIEYLNNDKLVVKNSYSQGYFSTEYTNTYIKR